MTEVPGSEPRFADEAGRYRLDSRIATGGMGEVWRGTDTTLGRPVAVKLLKDEYADDPSFRTRFQSEAQHAASLHHPNIAAVYDFGEAATADGSGSLRPFLVMELVDGQPLSALLRPEQPMDPGAVRELLAQAADGLGAAHAAGIVHRDVKPANLLVTPDRQVKVTDFGIARAAEGMGLTATGEVMGTPQYISPEQAEGYPATPASDVYSLGVVAFECLAGHRPFTADSPIATALAHIREPVPALPEGTPSDLGAVVRRSMSKLPQDRYADGAGLAAALRDPATAATAVVGNVPPPADETRILSAAVPAAPAPIPGPVPTTSDPKRTGGSLLPVLVPLAVAVVVALVVLFVLRSSGDDNGDSPGHRRSPSQGATSQAPTSQAPTTQAPTSEAPTTQAPTSQAPTSQAPTSQAPTTQAPTSQGPTSQAPTSAAPTSQAPTSQAPTSAAPTSRAATSAPASQAPASAAPSKPSSSAAAPAAPTGTGNRGEGEAR